MQQEIPPVQGSEVLGRLDKISVKRRILSSSAFNEHFNPKHVLL